MRERRRYWTKSAWRPVVGAGIPNTVGEGGVQLQQDESLPDRLVDGLSDLAVCWPGELRERTRLGFLELESQVERIRFQFEAIKPVLVCNAFPHRR